MVANQADNNKKVKVHRVWLLRTALCGEVKKDAMGEGVVSWRQQNKQRWAMPDEEVSTVGLGQQQ